MTYTTTLNRTNVNKLLSEMRAIHNRGNYAALMYSCRDKELFVDEFINAADYYDYPSYVKFVQRYIHPTFFKLMTASDILDLIEDFQDEYDYEQAMKAKEVM